MEKAKEILIVSGEGEQGTTESYAGDKTEKAIIARLIAEECNGDRWAFARIDGVRYDRKGATLEARY